MRRVPLGILIAALVPVAAPVARAPLSSGIAAAVADRTRPPTDRTIDVDRMPAKTLAFAGVRPGMQVGEFFPGGGYFTRMLSDVVGRSGHVYGIENAGWKGAVKADRALLAEGRLANVTIVAQPFGTVAFAKPLDLVWITQNYHDLKIAEFGNVDTAAFDRAVFAALKPGGIFFVLDHEAPRGTSASRPVPANISRRVVNALTPKNIVYTYGLCEPCQSWSRRSAECNHVPEPVTWPHTAL